jgi:hypothetical protein
MGWCGAAHRPEILDFSVRSMLLGGRIARMGPIPWYGRDKHLPHEAKTASPHHID